MRVSGVSEAVAGGTLTGCRWTGRSQTTWMCRNVKNEEALRGSYCYGYESLMP